MSIFWEKYPVWYKIVLDAVKWQKTENRRTVELQKSSRTLSSATLISLEIRFQTKHNKSQER